MMRRSGRRILPALLTISVFGGLLGQLLGPESAQAAHQKIATGFARPAHIRVRLGEALARAEVRGFDLRFHEKPSRTLASVTNKLSHWEFRCQDGRVRAIQAETGKALDLHEPVVIESPAGFLTYRSRPYREEIWIHSTGSLCEVVNHVDVEKYLEGLVNAEFSSKWSEEAIGAQVIAARSYAYHQILHMKEDLSNHFDVDATVRDQVYDGSIREDTRASRIVQKTRGMVLTVQEGSATTPLKAFYHSTCGGLTESPENVWGVRAAGFHRTVQCPYCVHSPVYRWNLEMTTAEISKIITGRVLRDGAPAEWPKNALSFVRGGRLVEIRASRSAQSVRVSEAVTVWSSANGTMRMELRLPGAKLREWIGAAKFRSTWFDVAQRSGRWVFEGRGNGHGVGMCQYGAKAMGEKGFKTASILQLYYPDAILRKMW